jgi:hypothetical protein
VCISFLRLFLCARPMQFMGLKKKGGFIVSQILSKTVFRLKSGFELKCLRLTGKNSELRERLQNENNCNRLLRHGEIKISGKEINKLFKTNSYHNCKSFYALQFLLH